MRNPGSGLRIAQAMPGASDAMMLGDPAGMGIVKLVTETVVGASILFRVVLFLKHLADERKARAESDTKRDESTREIAQNFQEQVRTIAGRFEASQEAAVTRYEKTQQQDAGVTREAVVTLANHDATIKNLAAQQRSF